MEKSNHTDTLDHGRKLSKEELRRKEKLEALTEQLTSEGYTRKDLTVSLLDANIKGPLLAVPFIVCEIVLHRIICGSIFAAGWDAGWIEAAWIWFVVLLLLIVAHELIHGITWGIFAEHHLKDIRFGVVWKMLTPYCTCTSPLKRCGYMIGGAMPTILLGFGLFAVSLINGSVPLYLLALVMTLSGSGDMLILYKLCRYKSDCRDILVYDHPYEGGSVLFER
ncbi:MAG: DUF3267 domain-containing protein [Oscillospiraceae bacterium]|nr:DUF3267 domain-containing protein [Oscillospiraceae bacterium]